MRSRNAATLLVVGLMTMTCAGCVTSGSGHPDLAVAVPAHECKRNPVSQVALKVGDDALALVAEYRKRLGLANRRIVAMDDCIERVVEGFAAPGAP
jgi:hypothetical protein